MYIPPGSTVLGDDGSSQPWTPPGSNPVNQHIPLGQSIWRHLLQGADFLAPNVVKSLNNAASNPNAQPWNNPGQAVKQNLPAGAELASWLLPGSDIAKGVDVGGKVGSLGVNTLVHNAPNAVAGGVNSAAQPGASPQSIAGGALGSMLMGKGAEGASSMLKGVGSDLSNRGDEVLLHDLKPNITQQKNFMKVSGGQPISDYIKQNGWNGDFANNAANHVDTLQNAFDGIARNSNIPMSTDALSNAFQPKIDELAASSIPSVQAKAKDLSALKDNILSKYGNGMSVADATKERSSIDDLISQNQFGLPAESATYLKSGRDALHDAVVNSTQGQTSPEGLDVGQLGKELSKAIQFKNIADQQALLGKGNKNIGLLATLFGGAGGSIGTAIGALLGGPVGAGLGAAAGTAGGLLTQKAVNSGPAVRGESAILKGTGSAMQKAGNMNLPMGGNNAMLRLLRNAGSNAGNAIGGLF